jgi:hypothetical protein
MSDEEQAKLSKMADHLSGIIGEFMTGGFVMVGYIGNEPVIMSQAGDKKTAIALNALVDVFILQRGAKPPAPDEK